MYNGEKTSLFSKWCWEVREATYKKMKLFAYAIYKNEPKI